MFMGRGFFDLDHVSGYLFKTDSKGKKWALRYFELDGEEKLLTYAGGRVCVYVCFSGTEDAQGPPMGGWKAVRDWVGKLPMCSY